VCCPVRTLKTELHCVSMFKYVAKISANCVSFDMYRIHENVDTQINENTTG
jgi:hypothetical protein